MKEIIDINSLKRGTRVRIYDDVCAEALALPEGKGLSVDRKVYLAVTTGMGYKKQFPNLRAFTTGGVYVICRKVPLPYIPLEDAPHES